MYSDISPDELLKQVEKMDLDQQNNARLKELLSHYKWDWKQLYFPLVRTCEDLLLVKPFLTHTQVLQILHYNLDDFEYQRYIDKINKFS